MSDLSEFLLARIAEDEEVATSRGQLAGDQWSALDPDRDDDVSVDVVGRGRGVVVNALRWEAVHIARHDPARVLAECEAKRRILEAFLDAERAVATYDHAHPTDAYWQEWGNRHALALAVELLGVPYADHPDYREEWRP